MFPPILNLISSGGRVIIINTANTVVYDMLNPLNFIVFVLVALNLNLRRVVDIAPALALKLLLSKRKRIYIFPVETKYYSFYLSHIVCLCNEWLHAVSGRSVSLSSVPLNDDSVS